MGREGFKTEIEVEGMAEEWEERQGKKRGWRERRNKETGIEWIQEKGEERRKGGKETRKYERKEKKT